MPKPASRVQTPKTIALKGLNFAGFMTVGNLRRTGLNGADKLFTTSPGWPQVVFATASLGIKTPFMRSLYDHVPQLCAQYFQRFNREFFGFMPTMHSPNNNYNKRDIK